jgi:hypothetical protein
MNLFEKAYKDGYIKYHTNPVVPNSLDPRVFYFPPEGGDPTIHPTVKNHILKDIASINTSEGDHGMTRVSDYIMVGSILKPNTPDNCPITIKLKLSTNNLTDVLKEKILNQIKSINSNIVAGTTHPIYYIPTIRDFDLNQYEAAYHPYTDKWLKKPRFLGESVKTLDGLARDPAKKKRKHMLVRNQLRPHQHQTKN